MALAACVGDDTESPPPPPPVEGPTFTLTGTVTNTISQAQHGRLVVAIARPEDVHNAVVCSKLLEKFERTGVSLPATYSLDRVPQGEYTLVALLIDDPSSAFAEGALAAIEVNGAGVHYGGRTVARITISLQGAISHDCR